MPAPGRTPRQEERHEERRLEEKDHEVWEEAETLADHFRETLISLRGMDLWPRRAAVLAIGGMVVAALLMATRQLAGPLVSTGGGATIPLVQLVGCAVLSVLAWSYLLAGALHAHAGLRVPVLVLFTLAGLTFVVQGLPDLAAEVVALATLVTRVHHTLTVPQDLSIARILAGDLPLPVLALSIVALLAGVWVVVLRRQPSPGAPRLGPATLLACGAVTVCLYALASVGSAYGSAYPLPEALDEQMLLFGFTVLPLVLFVTGSDFAEWAEVTAGKAVVSLRGVHRAIVPAAAVAVPLAVLVDAARVAGGVGPLIGSLPGTAVAAAVAVVLGLLLLRRARPLRVPLWGLLVAGVAAYLLTIMPPLRGIVLDVWIVVLAVAAALAVLVARGRPRLAIPALLFGSVLAVSALDDWHFGGGSILTPEQLRAGGAVVCLAGTGLALARYRLAPRGLQLMRLFLVLLLGLQALDWLTDLFEVSSALELAAPQAAVMLLGLLWDVTTSGESVTNVKGRRVPHHSRVLIYFGYELIAATAIVWFYASTDGEAFRDTDSWVSSGIQLLGAPLLIVFCAIGLVSWRRAGRRSVGGEAPPARS